MWTQIRYVGRAGEGNPGSGDPISKITGTPNGGGTCHRKKKGKLTAAQGPDYMNFLPTQRKRGKEEAGRRGSREKGEIHVIHCKK